jgi:nucleotide-binding universal stress UspA family protein
VADKVIRLGHRPTLLVRPPVARGSGEQMVLRCLLVPLDGSELAEGAIAPAARLAEALGAKLLFARAEEWLTTALAQWTGEGTSIANLAELEQETTAMAEAYLDGIRRQLPSSVRCETAVQRGSPVQELESLFRERRADLVVMTRHRRGGLSRLVLGSTADRFIQDGLPTLLIPPSLPAQEHESRVLARGKLGEPWRQRRADPTHGHDRYGALPRAPRTLEAPAAPQ